MGWFDDCFDSANMRKGVTEARSDNRSLFYTRPSAGPNGRRPRASRAHRDDVSWHIIIVAAYVQPLLGEMNLVKMRKGSKKETHLHRVVPLPVRRADMKSNGMAPIGLNHEREPPISARRLSARAQVHLSSGRDERDKRAHLIN